MKYRIITNTMLTKPEFASLEDAKKYVQELSAQGHKQLTILEVAREFNLIPQFELVEKL